jgi:hypothetical protein
MISHSNENVLMDDANSPELNRQLLGKVSGDFIIVAEHLKEATYHIKKRGFSDFPIFVLSEMEIEIGGKLFLSSDFQTKYNYNASFVEEFIERNLIGEESIELFKENYKNTDEFCCLFVMDADFAGFVFMPYPED